MLRLKIVLQVIVLAMPVACTQVVVAQSAAPSNLQKISFSASSSSYSSSAEDSTGAPPPAPYRPLPIEKQEGAHAFSYVQLGFKASTLGAGVELSTPLSRHFGMRSQFNFISFKAPISMDGVDYDSRFKLSSGSLGLDWYPTRHSFRISPGVLYFNNNVDALASVKPGNDFRLASNNFINSVDDPLNGDAKITFDRHVAPMVVLGVNLIGNRQSRFSMPIEVGAAYTGAVKVDVTLNGTACTNQGCFTFADNQYAQDSLREEIIKLNRRLSSYSVYPVVSVGFAYRFWGRR